MADSRRYLKRVWRVPKPKPSGAFVAPEETLGTLVKKMLRKHGWPAELRVIPRDFSAYGAFEILHDKLGQHGPLDFTDAVSRAVRIVTAQKRVCVHELSGYVEFIVSYRVTEAGDFREMAETPETPEPPFDPIEYEE